MPQALSQPWGKHHVSEAVSPSRTSPCGGLDSPGDGIFNAVGEDKSCENVEDECHGNNCW